MARKINDEALLLALACGATVEAAARQNGVAERSVYRRMQQPDFADRLRSLRSDMASRAAGALTAASTESVRTLLTLQKEPHPPAVRLGAARAVLEIGMKLREVVDLEKRLADLEQRLQASEAGPNYRGVA